MMLKVWLYSITSFFSLAVMLAARHAVEGARFLGESLGLVIVLLSCQVCFHLNGIDELLVDSKPHIFLQKTIKSIGAGLIIAALFFYAFPRLSPGYAAAATSAFFLLFGLVVLRPIVRTLIRRREAAETTLIVGSEDVAQKLYNEIVAEGSTRRVRVVPTEDLSRFTKVDTVSRVVVADPVIDKGNGIAQSLIDFKLRGVTIETAVESFEKTSRKICIEALSPEWLIFTNGFSPSKLYLTFKRLFDILLSATVLIITAPLMALIALAIKLDSAGPVIFSQERVGFLGKRFTVYKFRSMREDAEKLSGPTWAKEQDERVTRVGAFLRKCRLDELPQVYNVLRGDMSFVGPRPERPYFVDLLNSEIRYYDLRHYVKPGITGWAQVMYPYGASIEDAYNKLQYDLYYAKNISLSLDLITLFKTIKVVFAGEGR